MNDHIGIKKERHYQVTSGSTESSRERWDNPSLEMTEWSLPLEMERIWREHGKAKFHFEKKGDILLPMA